MKTLRSAENVLNCLLTHLAFDKDVQLATWLGVSAQAISQAKRKNKIPESWLVRAAVRGSISLDWLLFDNAAKNSTRSCSAFDDTSRNNITFIPLVAARLSAGGGSLETQGDVLSHFAFRQDWLSKKGNPKDMVLMRVSGDSMEPLIQHNDLVLIDQGKTDFVPHTIFAVGIDDEIYIKQLDTFPGHKLILRSLNERYDPIEVDMRGDLAGSIRILGKAIWWCHEI